MLRYILKRLLWFIPTVLAVTCIGFFLLASAPGDPVNRMVTSTSMSGSLKAGGDIETQKNYWRKQLGLDLPVFYFKIARLSEPDTLYKIYDKEKQKTFLALLDETGNAETITAYFASIEFVRNNYEKQMHRDATTDTSKSFVKHQKQLKAIGISIDALSRTSDFEQQLFHLNSIKQNLKYFPENIPNIPGPLENSINTLQHNTSGYKNFFPKFVWYGFNNQYHRWLFGGPNSGGIIRGDFGISYVKKEPVMFILKDKLIWSLFFSIISIILAYAISIPIGIRISEKPEHSMSKASQLMLFILYSMPAFFVGVLLLMLFANPDVLSIFPPSGIKPIGGYDDDASLMDKFIASLPYMVLPLVCYTYSSLAFITRLTTGSLQEQMGLDYIKTARAKGLTDKAVIRKHAFRNSLLPLITVFSTVFPGIIGGSVIIESIFTIPGMGLETVRAILSQDYPLVIAILTLSSLLTIFSYLLADVLYTWADPRIRLKH